MKKIVSTLITLATLFSFVIPFTADAASAQVYYPIDFSAAVLKSRVQQQVSGDCAVVSMATIESYLYGTTSSADKKTVYKTLVAKNKDDNYAYWGNCGYQTKTIDWDFVYDQLSKGYPVIVHRPANGKKSQHWAVVAGYKGSATTLEKDKFVIVDVYDKDYKLTDVYTSKDWRNGTTIDRLAYRKNGISMTAFSGIRFAINHPAIIHPNGQGHGVYGYVTSNENITALQVRVTNIKTGKTVFNKTLTPNSKSYKLYNLDSEMTFAKWENGEYYYTVIAQTASTTKAYNTYFQIASSYPSSSPTTYYTYSFNTNGGEGNFPSQTIAHNGKIVFPEEHPVKEGYVFKGWYVTRSTDSKSYCTSGKWLTESEISDGGFIKKVYNPGESYNHSYEWIKGAFSNLSYTFHAIWAEASLVSVIIDESSSPDIGGSIIVDVEAMIDSNADFKTAYEAGSVQFTWYVNGSKIDTSNNTVLEVTDTLAGCDIQVSVSYSGNTAASEVITIPSSSYLNGDANGDGRINITDVSLIVKSIAQWDVVYIFEAAEVTGDGKVNIADAMAILKYIAGWNIDFK